MPKLYCKFPISLHQIVKYQNKTNKNNKNKGNKINFYIWWVRLNQMGINNY